MNVYQMIIVIMELISLVPLIQLLYSHQMKSQIVCVYQVIET